MGVFNFSTSLNNVTYDEDGINLISSNKGDLSSFDFSEFTSSSSLLNNSGGESFLGNGTVGIGNGTATVAHLGRDEFLAKIEQLVLILIFIFTVAGNFLVLMGIYFRKEKMSRMYYFILHLAIADLTTAFFNVLTQLFWEMTHRFQGGAFMCKFVKYTQILGPYSSSYILVMTALDRYQAICYPLSNCSWTARRSKFMLGTAWTLAILFCLPQIYIFNYQEISHGAEVMVYDCWGTFAPDWGEKAYITWYCITIFIVPLIILVFAYTCITRAIWINFNMKNAVMKEERSGKRFTRDDSDEMDDGKGVHGGELDCTIVDDNESSICQDTTKVSSDKQSSMRNNGSVKAKNLEVSWHQTKQGTRTRASSIRKDETTGGNKRCQSYSGSHHQVPTTNLKRDSLSVIPNPRYFEKGKFFSDNSPCNDTKQRNNKCILLDENNETALLSSSTLMSKGNYGDKASFASQMNATTASHGCDTDKRHNGKILESADRKTQPQRWSSMSTKSGCLRAHFETGARDLDNKEVIQVKDGKSNFLTPLQNGSSSAAVSSHIKNRKRCSSKSSTKTMMQIQPRTHSVKGISRAKIKTVKLTVTVICCYIVCSTPFIAALLWSAYDPYAKIHPFWFGKLNEEFAFSCSIQKSSVTQVF
jgi:hypothetical protein